MSGANGKQQSLEQIREQLEIAHTSIRLREAELQLRMMSRAVPSSIEEGWYAGYGSSYTGYTWGDFVDPADRFRDGDRFIFSPTGSIQDRVAGNNGPFVITEDSLLRVRNRARYLAQRNPIGIGALEALTDFIVGEGMQPVISSKEGASKQLIRQCQDVIDEFVDVNEYDEWQQELVQRAITDGEYFEQYFQDQDQLILRAIEPEQIQQPLGSPRDIWSWGIRNRIGDVARAEAYAVFPYITYGAEYDDWQEVSAENVCHVRRNTVRNVKRGMSDFYPVDEQLDGSIKLLRNMREGESVRQAIVGFWQYEQASSSTVAAHIQATQDGTQPYVSSPLSQKAVQAQKFEPGTIPHVPKGKVFVPPPASTAIQGAVAVIQAVLRAGIGVRWGMPEYLISGDSSNSNFASTLVSGAPFTKRILRGQKFFKRRFLRTLWRAMRLAYDLGRIAAGSWEELRYLIEILLEAPKPTIANDLTDAQADEIDMRNGVLSKQTRRQKRGLDNEQEQQNIKADPIAPPPQPGTSPGGGASFFPRLSAG
jgi:hypothetical protein